MWRHREPFYLPYHEPALVIERQWNTCSFLLDTKPFVKWGKWESGPPSKRHPWPRHRTTRKSPLYIFEASGQPLHSAVSSNQVRWSCTWQRSLSRETNTGATDKIPAHNQSWRGCNHLTSNWPYQGHQVPYLVPRTAKCFCGQTLTIDYMFLVCAALQECRDLNYTAGSLDTLFETIPEICIAELLR